MRVREMAEAGLKEDNATNRAEWRKMLISYTGDPRWRDKPGTMKKMNDLPDNLRLIDSVVLFKRYLKTHLIKGSILRLFVNMI